MNREQALRLLKAVKQTREAQKQYFHTKHRTDLVIARDEERRLDALVKECETAAVQGALFPQKPNTL